MDRGTKDMPVVYLDNETLSVSEFARLDHVHNELGRCVKNRFGPICSSKVTVILFKDSGKYYTQEKWRVPDRAIGPYDMDKSEDFHRIGGGAVLISPEDGEPFGYPHLFNKENEGNDGKD